MNRTHYLVKVGSKFIRWGTRSMEWQLTADITKAEVFNSHDDAEGAAQWWEAMVGGKPRIEETIL